MKKIFTIMAILFLAFSFTSCEEFIAASRVDWETSVLKIERDKLPIRISDYQNKGINVSNIKIDTVVMTYGSNGNLTPDWGYMKTVWEYKSNFLNDGDYEFLFESEINRKEVVVELEDCGTEGGKVKYKAKWPDEIILN